MFKNLLNRLRHPQVVVKVPEETIVENTRVLTSDELIKPLSTVIEHLYSAVPVDQEYFNKFYLKPIHSLAKLVQQLPASSGHHHSHRSGLIHHSVELALFAVRLSKKHVYMDKNETSIAELSDRYTYACFTCALFHDAAKIVTDISIVYRKNSSDEWKKWNPLQGPLTIGVEYKYQYKENRNYLAHQASAILVARQCLDDSSMEWLKSNDSIFNNWILCLSGHQDKAGIIGNIVANADRFSVKAAIGHSNSPKNTADTKALGIHTRIKNMIEKADDLNKSGNPFFVQQGHIFMIHPRWMDDLIENDTNKRSEQNKLLNILSESDQLVKTTDKKALQRFIYSMTSDKYGNINNVPLAAIIIRRELIDPDCTLPTCELTISPTEAYPIPKELVYASIKCHENSIEDKISHSSVENEIINKENNESIINRNNTRPIHSLETNDSNISKTENTEICSTEAPSVNEDNTQSTIYNSGFEDLPLEQSLYLEYQTLQQERNIGSAIINNEQLQNPDHIKETSCDTAPQYSGIVDKVIKRNKVNSNFNKFITDISLDKNAVNKPQAVLHKIDNYIYLIWPEIITRFERRVRSKLPQNLRVDSGRNEKLERFILNQGFHDIRNNNENFYQIQFKSRRNDSEFGPIVSGIRLNSSFGQQEEFAKLKNNTAGKVTSI